jgi:hypothetical protein
MCYHVILQNSSEEIEHMYEIWKASRLEFMEKRAGLCLAHADFSTPFTNQMTLRPLFPVEQQTNSGLGRLTVAVSTLHTIRHAHSR